ncbi:putative cysteine desulfurase [Posidoniimonas corsicana]|uniref:Putative cysteine desulfurase n=1 Tax=Posidoniimonas corsicana TaxID=1938618 RepID=A0A5C5V6N0_9BACT|nr:aminotransferase class V-fold PLP-dependent enzyme [Posidoniimonas corsicana]TWT33770.1 putative cysteine desulfurase [Posidoniimonas corsicana]
MLSVRDDFLAFTCDPTLVYLDSAATTLKPRCVVDEVSWCLTEGASAIYRGVHRRGVELTARFDDARATIARWFGVADDEVVITTGATGAINLVRNGWPDLNSVVTTIVEHHSNLLPWTNVQSCRTLPCDPCGRVSAEDLDKELLSAPADLVAVSHVSNVLGVIQPVSELAEVAHRHGALLLLDAAQSASHLPVEPNLCGADFIACSGHKMLGPSGVGALVATSEALARLKPISWGGGMVESVSPDDVRLQPAPRRFEAGTPPVESVLGWATALDYLESIGRENLTEHTRALTLAAIKRFSGVRGVRVHGPADVEEQLGIVSLSVDGWESHAAARVLSQRGNICVRSGFHCAEPLHQRLGLRPTLRLSFQAYNDHSDIEKACAVIEQLAQTQIG